MQAVNYPSRSFAATFNAALQTSVAFTVVVTNLRKRLAVIRTIKRLKNEPTDDRFFISLFDKISLFEFYPRMADAWLNHHYNIELNEERGRLVLTFQPSAQ